MELTLLEAYYGSPDDFESEKVFNFFKEMVAYQFWSKKQSEVRLGIASALSCLTS